MSEVWYRWWFGTLGSPPCWVWSSHHWVTITVTVFSKLWLRKHNLTKNFFAAWDRRISLRDGVWTLKYWDHWHMVPIKMDIFRDMSKEGGITSTTLGIECWGCRQESWHSSADCHHGEVGTVVRGFLVLREVRYLSFFVFDFSPPPPFFMLVTNSQFSMDQR